MARPGAAISLAARMRARLYDPRRRLPANATTRSATAASGRPLAGRRERRFAAADSQEHQPVRAAGAGLDVLGHGERLAQREPVQQIELEPHDDKLAGPPWWIFHDPTLPARW